MFLFHLKKKRFKNHLKKGKTSKGKLLSATIVKFSTGNNLNRTYWIDQSFDDDCCCWSVPKLPLGDCLNPTFDEDVVAAASDVCCCIMLGGGPNGMGLISSSISNLGITILSWLWPWWWLCPVCWCCWDFAIADVVWGKDFGKVFDASVLSAFHRSFRAFSAIARRLSLSCWSLGVIDIVSDRMSLELEWFSGMIGWCFTSPIFRLILYIGFTSKLIKGCIAVGKKLQRKICDKKIMQWDTFQQTWLTSQTWNFQNLCHECCFRVADKIVNRWMMTPDPSKTWLDTCRWLNLPPTK